MSKEIRINKNNVELTIHFKTIEELEEQMKNHEKIWELVEKYGGFNLEKKSIREDLEGICDLEDGLIILKRNPESPLHKVILAIYAYGPKGATPADISITTGIPKPSGTVITPTKNKKYFRKLENDRWYLSDKGLEMVHKIIQKLREKDDSSSN